ncbi:hypothetical protein P7K49_006254 [Saguinus oedipus]|uniref:Uncharacterized protein n=1 Tax=Saguinus oedipus TaxID=9490 RepID=A0ABQ9W4A6_SAGOE|nr:hypothetical protein P7K49_006254 [Saguinus oedipus]
MLMACGSILSCQGSVTEIQRDDDFAHKPSTEIHVSVLCPSAMPFLEENYTIKPGEGTGLLLQQKESMVKAEGFYPGGPCMNASSVGPQHPLAE